LIRNIDRTKQFLQVKNGITNLKELGTPQLIFFFLC